MKLTSKNRKDRAFSIGIICDTFSLKRDAYYKHIKRYSVKKEEEQTVIELIRKSKKTLPKEGPRKLMKTLYNDFQKQRLKMDRDKLFNI